MRRRLLLTQARPRRKGLRGWGGLERLSRRFGRTCGSRDRGGGSDVFLGGFLGCPGQGAERQGGENRTRRRLRQVGGRWLSGRRRCYVVAARSRNVMDHKHRSRTQYAYSVRMVRRQPLDSDPRSSCPLPRRSTLARAVELAARPRSRHRLQLTHFPKLAMRVRLTVLAFPLAPAACRPSGDGGASSPWASTRTGSRPCAAASSCTR